MTGSSSLGRLSPSLALAAWTPRSTAIQRASTTASGTVYDTIDKKAEQSYGTELLQANPDEVSGDSSTRHVMAEARSETDKDVDMLAGLKADLITIRETFALRDVPREALYIGLAGVLPYLATSLSTLYLAWDINISHATGMGFLVSGATAESLLNILEPLQVGYGAVIISFLGAIHWGLEFAKYGGYHQGYRRYLIGVVAPAVAWPTILLPVEYALITQFIAFIFLYFADARAAVRGWAPAWYSTYRFVLTFIVGASLVASLIGRGEIADKMGSLPGPAEKMKALRDQEWENLEKEEEERSAHAADDNGEGEGDGESAEEE
ncbi:MAG: hypothetical protein M1838_001171 [Thelocarpon superellum]|nr:MAG: hypothetical protein M1838_001171 [Thelocarpon superellum]